MKKTLLPLFIIALVITANYSISQPTGAPSPSTGSPADGTTCFQGGCHFGAPEAKDGIISTDVPSGGYAPGKTYTVTVTLAGTGAKGFEISPQKEDGTLLGKLTAGSGSKLVNGAVYITHSTPKTGNPAVWTFKWRAPGKGTGAVDFYGAFAVTRDNTYTQKITVQEDATAAGVVEALSLNDLNIYPNPVKDNLRLSFDLKENAALTIMLTDITGKRSVELYNKTLSGGMQSIDMAKPADINTGIYLLQIKLNDQTTTRKIFIE